MRQIGSLTHQPEAERFTAYLITQGIAAQAEEDDGVWTIWVRNEDQLQTAAERLTEFRQQPGSDRYRDALREANAKLQQEAKRRDHSRRHFVAMGDRWRRQNSGNSPLVNAIIGLCVAVFFLTSFGNPATTAYRALAFADPVHDRGANWNPDSWHDRAVDIRQGQVWRLVTPIFMHGDLVHLAFNMIMFYLFAGQIERRRGAWRLALLILLTAAISNAIQGLAPTDWGTLSGTHRFLGLSGVVYGLLGYLWMKTVHDPGAGLFVNQSTVAFLVIWMFLGFAGVLGSFGIHIANLAHGAGLLVGMGAGYLPIKR